MAPEEARALRQGKAAAEDDGKHCCRDKPERQPPRRQARGNVTEVHDPRLREREDGDRKRDDIPHDERDERARARPREWRLSHRHTAPTPPVREEREKNGGRRDEAQIRADIPVRRRRFERWKPAERIEPEDLSEHLVPLLLEGVVQGARGHRAQDERERGGDPDQ